MKSYQKFTIVSLLFCLFALFMPLTVTPTNATGVFTTHITGNVSSRGVGVAGVSIVCYDINPSPGQGYGVFVTTDIAGNYDCALVSFGETYGVSSGDTNNIHLTPTQYLVDTSSGETYYTGRDFIYTP